MTMNILAFTKPGLFTRRPQLFTIGYEGRSIGQFIDRLLAYDIRILIDVRNSPISRKPGFSKTALRELLESVGIGYRHIPELGVPSALRKNLGTAASYASLFRYYEKSILASNLDLVEQIKLMTAQSSRVALTCFEADYRACHRHRITEHLSQDPSFRAEIVHLN